MNFNIVTLWTDKLFYFGHFRIELFMILDSSFSLISEFFKILHICSGFLEEADR